MSKDSNSDRPLVSIVLNTFNTDRFVGEQIESILGQTYTNFELIICDDHSTDQTPAIVRKFVEKDSRVKAVPIERTAGVSDRNYRVSLTFETGFAICRGEFIATSDADDRWLPVKIQRQVDYLLTHPETDLVFTDSMIVSEDLTMEMGSFQRKMGNLSEGGPISIDVLLERNLLPGHAMFFRRNLLPQIIPVPFGFSLDSWVALVASLQAPLGYIAECTVLYRQHQRNASSANIRGLKYYWRQYNDPRFLRDYAQDKSGQLEGHEKLLDFKCGEHAQEALREKIANQRGLFSVMEATSFPQFIRRLLHSAWTILRSSQKYHLKQWLFLAFSWGNIRRMKSG